MKSLWAYCASSRVRVCDWEALCLTDIVCRFQGYRLRRDRAMPQHVKEIELTLRSNFDIKITCCINLTGMVSLF